MATRPVGRSRRVDASSSAVTSSYRVSIPILAKFACPFVPVLRYKGKTTCSIGASCPFGHPPAKPSVGYFTVTPTVTSTTEEASPPNSHPVALTTLPKYICAHHLVGLCNRSVTGDRCPSGLHLRRPQRELANLALLEARASMAPRKRRGLPMKTPITPKTPKFDNDEHEVIELEDSDEEVEEVEHSEKDLPRHECAICYEAINPPEASDEPSLFMIQENCNHLFCPDCTITWYEQPNTDRRCAMCRASSSTLVMVQKLPETDQEKRRLFEYQKQIIALSINEAASTLRLPSFLFGPNGQALAAAAGAVGSGRGGGDTPTGGVNLLTDMERLERRYTLMRLLMVGPNAPLNAAAARADWTDGSQGQAENTRN